MTIRFIEIVRSLWGAVLLVRSKQLLHWMDRAETDHLAVVVVQVLGARHIVQAAISGIHPSPEVLAAGAWVDTVHSVTALGLAGLDRHRAVLGLMDAAIAALWALFGLRDLRPGRNPIAAKRDRCRDRLARTMLPRLPGGRAFLARAERV